MDGTDATEEVFLEVELAGAWSLCFKHFENLELSGRVLLGRSQLAGRSYFHAFCDHLFPAVSYRIKLLWIIDERCNAPRGHSDHLQKPQYYGSPFVK